MDQVDQVMFDILLLENNYFDLRDYVLLTRKEEEEEDARSMSRKKIIELTRNLYSVFRYKSVTVYVHDEPVYLFRK